MVSTAAPAIAAVSARRTWGARRNRTGVSPPGAADRSAPTSSGSNPPSGPTTSIHSPPAGEELAQLPAPSGGEWVLVVGPEGGFDPDEAAALEVVAAHGRGAPARLRLGPHVLRAETAAIAGAAVLTTRRAPKPDD